MPTQYLRDGHVSERHFSEIKHRIEDMFPLVLHATECYGHKYIQ